jgi:GntR family transcriptional regulator
MGPPDLRHSRRIADASRRVRDLLRSELHRGGFADGRLPPEDVLIREYRTSRAVVRGALAVLRSEGLIDRIQGIGTISMASIELFPLEESQGVATPRPSSPLAGRSQPVILDHSEIELATAVAERLGVAPGSAGVRIDYVSYFGGYPAWIATNYMRRPEADQLVPDRFRTDFYAYLAECGLQTSATSYLMTAALADELDGPLLDVIPGSPIMAGEQTIFNADDEPFNFALVRMRADRYAILARSERRADPRN